MASRIGQIVQNPLNIFYSYDPKDEALREELETHLSLLYHQGVISSWSKRDIRAGSDWQQEADRQLEQAHLILFLVSSDFLASPYSSSREMHRAMARHEAGEALVIPIILRPVAWERAPFGKLQVLPREGIPITSSKHWESTDAAWTNVVQEVERVIAQLSLTLSNFPSSSPSSQSIWHVPYRRNPFFTGREELLEQIYHWFTSVNTGNAVALTQSLAINGLGGIGKTQIALEYAYRYRQEYQTVLWVAAATKEILQTDLLQMAEQLPLPSHDPRDLLQTLTALKAWMAAQKGWLLILDNADDLVMASSFLPEGEVWGHILFTTRADAGGEVAHTVPVEEMEGANGVLLLLRRAKMLSPGATLEQTRDKVRIEAQAIVKALGGLPLALDQAGAYIEETRCSLVGYLHLYQTRRKELLQRRGRLSMTHADPVATTWSLSFRLIEQANPTAAKLLQACAFLDPDAIPESLFLEGGEAFGEPLAALVADEYALDGAIEELNTFSLIQRNVEDRTLSIHRLVQAVLRDGLMESEARQQAEHIIHGLKAVYPQVKFETWEWCRQLLPHVQVAEALIETYQLSSEDAGALLDRAGWYLREQYLFVQAEQFLQRALRIREQRLGAGHPDIAATLDNLGSLYWIQGQYQKAELLFQQALGIREQSLGTEHLDTAATLNNLGLLYQDQGRYTQAETLFQRALAIREQELGIQHHDTARTMNDLGLLYYALGQYQEAETLFQRALAISEQLLGAEYPSTAAALNNLGLVFFSQGQYTQAELLFQRALTIYEQRLGAQHPFTATGLSNLASFHQAQGRYGEAEPLYQRALEIWEQELGPTHPSTALSVNNLAGLYYAQGKYGEAEPLYRRAVEIWEESLGPGHPSTRIGRENYAGVLRELGREEEARALEEEGD